MSHPEYPAGNPPEQGSDPWRPAGTYGSASVPPPQQQPPEQPPPQPPPQPTSPAQPGYPTALEPPGPVVPSQPGGVHDRPTTLSYAPGSASPASPAPPYPPTLSSPAGYPPGGQMSGPPGGQMSGPPGGQMGGQPGAGPWQPEPMRPQQPPPARSGGGAKVGLIIVSVVAVLLLGFGGLMTYFWLDTSTELDETRADLTSQVEDLEGTVTNRDGQIDGLQGQLDEAREDVQNLETLLEGSEGEIEFLQEANDAIAVCLDMIEEWLFIIVVEENEAAANQHFDNELEPACDEAEQYR